MTGTNLNEDTDLKAFLGKYLRAWPLLGIAGLALLALVVVIMIIVQPMYSGSTSILIATPMRHDDPNRMVQPTQPVAKTDKNYYSNEQLRITSEPIISRVVDRLGLRNKYVQEGFFLDWEVYKDTPIQVELDTSSVHNVVHVPYGVGFYLHDVQGDNFKLVGDGKYGPDDLEIELEQDGKFGEWIKLDSARVRITRVMKSKLPLEGDDVENYGFILYDPHGVTLGLMGSILGELTVAEATTVNVTLTAAPKPKVLDILNGIGEEYTSLHMEEQKTELAKTITMLEGEITRNTGQLNSTSDLLEKFKTEANVTNMEHATILLQEGLKSLDAQRESLVVQTNYYDNLVKLLRSGDSAKPSSPKAYGISDPLLNDMTTKYAALQSDISVLREEGKTANPSFNRMVRLLDQQRENILSSVESFKANTRISLDNVDLQRRTLMAQQGEIPKLDRTLTDRERDQRTQEAVNTDLLTRLSNLRVQFAALAPEVYVTTPAYITDMDPFFPDIVILLAVAVMLALLAPLGYLIIKSLFSDKITGASTLAKAMPDVPLAARIPYTTHKDPGGLLTNPASPAYVEIAKLAALIETAHTTGPELDMVCGAGGKEAVGATAARLAWMLAQRGSRVMLVQETEATPRQTGAPAGLSIIAAKGISLSAIRSRAQEEGTAFVIIEGSNGDALAITPQVASLDRALVVCQPGTTSKGDLEKLGMSRANGQLPPLMFVLDGIMDKPLPWFGLAKKKGEKRLGFFDFFRYNWNRAV
ncbi:MAG: hypothetical protein IPN44_13640 [Flavobacteriales bacterium]|jgi:uncharacterized protein involved in exopolysaccharide biosynthesis|nr:hypothetical protein [Flavobacteriales bacterium]MCI1752176.1 hypothetical protein [Flavobacteriales bacterium]